MKKGELNMILSQSNKRRNREMNAIRKNIIKDAQMLVKDIKRSKKGKADDLVRFIHRHLLFNAEMNQLVVNYLSYLNDNVDKPSYVVSSLFLQESFALLNKRPVESLHFVTGPEIGNIKVLDKIVDFSLEKQSPVFAKAEAGSVRNALIYLSRHEYMLWGCFHIHPGSGANSTHPSTTDMTLDRLLDKGGYECIGAIFSRDGYVRFFSSKEFEINVYGKGAIKVDEKLFRLVKVK